MNAGGETSPARFFGGEFSGAFDSLAGEIRVELALYPEAGTFDYRDDRLGRVQGGFSELSSGRAGYRWALLELKRGRERTELLVRERDGGIELRPMQSVRNQLGLLPMADSLHLTPAD